MFQLDQTVGQIDHPRGGRSLVAASDLERTAQAADRRSDIANASLAAGKSLQIGGNYFGVLGSVGVLVDRYRPSQSAYRRTGIAELQFDRCNVV